MAIGDGIGNISNFKIYDEYVRTRINELLAQNGNAFNEASRGAINLTTRSIPGNYSYNSFFVNMGAALAARRDPTSASSQSDTPMTQDEIITVKLSRKLVPITQTRDAFRKMMGRFTQTEFSGLVGEQYADAMKLEMLNTGLAAVRAALKQQSASYYTAGSLGTITTKDLIGMLNMMGDAASKIVCWVMHSKPYYDLVKEQIGANITNVANLNVQTAMPVTCNRPVIVTDSSALVTQLASPDVNNYFTLGLTANAVQIENSEEQDVVVQDVTGNENLSVRIQGEYAYNLGVGGFKYHTATGANPSDAAIVTGTNWDTAFTSVKNRAGICGMTL